MTRRTRLLVGLAILLPVSAHLLYAAWASPLGGYYLTIDELRTQEAQGRTVRVGGEVLQGSVRWDRPGGYVHFVLADGNQQLLVVSPAPVPDAFQAGVSAIVQGRLDSEGRFVASEVLTKCPHAYLE